MSEVKVNIDLDLGTDKAKDQLNDFKKSVKDDKVPIELDIKKIEGDALSLKNILTNAFKLDESTLGNLKQVENSLKQINDLLKNQSRLMESSQSKDSIFGNISANESSIREYLAVSKKIDDIISKLYKSENRNDSDTISSLQTELKLLEEKRDKIKQLVDVNTEYVRQERELSTASAITSMSREDDASRKNNLKAEGEELKSLITLYDKYEKELTSLKIKQQELMYEGKDGQANALTNQIQSLEELKNTLKEVNNEKFGDKLYPELERIETKYREIARVAEEVSRGAFDDANTRQLEKSYQELDKIQQKLDQMQRSRGFLDEGLIQNVNSLLSDTRANLDSNGISSDFDRINQSVRDLNNHLSDLNTGNTLSRQEASFNASLQSMENRVESFTDRCREMGNAEHLIERVEQAFRSIDSSNIERANVDLRQMSTTLNQAEREARQLSSTMNNTRTFFGNFGDEFRSNLFTFTAGELLADGIRNIGYSLKTLVMEYDQAFTNLKKVANPEDIMNVNQLDAIEKKAVEIAKNVGQSSQDTIQAIADTIQMAGLGMEESILVAEQTMKLANVAEMTQQAASEGVVTMLSAFNLDPLKEIPIVVNGVTQSTNEMVDAFDKINFVGNNFAISSEGILDAITSGANVLASYGVSMNDTIAMIGAANTTLQDSSRVGNGLKTIAVNLAGIKASADTGELSLNKCAKTLGEVAKIDIFADKKTNQLKGMSTIIEELAAKWENFDDVQRAGIAEAVAGKQQAAVFQSLMSNFETMQQIQGELGNGEHWQSMEKENAQYVDSLSGQLNKLKETWVGIFNTIFSSDATKTIIKGLITISEAIAKVIMALDDVGMLTPALGVLAGIVGSKLLKGFIGLGGALSGTGAAAQTMSTTLPLATRVLGLFGGGATATATATGSATVAMGGLATGLSTMMPWILGATAAIGATAIAIDYFTESLDEEKQRLEDTISSRKNEISSLEEQKGSLEDVAKEYDKLNNKPKKTSDEVERLKELTNEIATIMPDLVVGYDSQGNAILNMTGDVSELVKELDAAIDRKNRLLKHEQADLAENSIKQLYGSGNSNDTSIKGMSANSKSEMGKLEVLTKKHVDEMAKLENKRDTLLGKLYGSTGKERQQIAKDIDDINYQIEKSQSDFNQEYMLQLDVIKEYTDKVGEGLFAGLENSVSFRNASDETKQQFLDFKNILDFSDIKTEEQLYEVEKALSRFLKVANDGDIDIKGLQESISTINSEFNRTGNLESYNKSMEQLAQEISKVSGVDANILTDLFTQFDTSVLKGKDALDEFLRSYGKTKEDLLNGDNFAKALANQKQGIDDWIQSLNDIGYDTEIDLELAYNLVSDSDLPEQVRDMVRTLLNKGHDPTQVLDVAQQILIDLSDGEVDVASVQELLNRTFGEGAFEVNSKILLNTEAEIAGVEDVVSRLKEKYGEIPTEIETAIRVDSVTSYFEAERILSLYNIFPDEVKTVISSNGYETVKDLELIQQLFTNLPPEQAMNIITNYSDIIKDSENLEEILSGLSRTPLNIETTVNADDAVNKINELVNVPLKDKILGIKGDNTDATLKADETDQKINEVEQDSPIRIEADATDAINEVTILGNKLKSLPSAKTVDITVKTTNKTVNPGVSGNLWDTRSFTPATMSSAISDGNEIALLSDNTSPETIANASVYDSPLARKTQSTSISMSDKDINDSLKYSIELLKELDNRIKMVNNSASLLDKKMKDAVGKEKIDYLLQQNQLYKEQIELQSELENKLTKQLEVYKTYLSGKGIQFTSDGNIKNYEETLLMMEREADKLDEIAKKKEEAYRNTSSETSQSQKDKLSKEYEDAKNVADKYNDSLSEVKKYLNEYLNIALSELPKVKEEFEDLNQAIKENEQAIKNMKYELKELNRDSTWTSIYKDVQQVSKEIEMLDKKLQHAQGIEKIELLSKKLELLEKQKKEIQDTISYLNSLQSELQNELEGYGFGFRDNGDITNYIQQMNKLKESLPEDEFNKVAAAAQEYLDILINKIPDAQIEIEGLNNAIKDSYKEQLNVTKEIEDKITQMYKKQVEERKKLIDEELNHRLKALDKEKKAYNDARKEADYNRDYEDQKDVVSDLQRQLEIAQRDTSLNGQKRVQELLKQLQEEQRKLEDLVQDKIDEDINSMFDKESERLEEEANNKKEDLDEKYSDDKLQQIVKDALTNGVFVDIDGNLKDLQSALLEFEDKFGDGMSAIGALIKSELITNLEIAKDTIKDLANILDKLDMSEFASMSSFSTPRGFTPDSTSSSYSNTVQFNAPLIVVEGDVSEDVLPRLDSLISQAEKRITKNILRQVK